MIPIPVPSDIRQYDLQDSELLQKASNPFGVSVFIPESTAIVLGRGSDAGRAVNWDQLESDPVPVYRRPSGGESVVISSNTLVIGIVKSGEILRNPSVYFETYNNLIVRILQGLGVSKLKKRGFSDICIGEKKILGSSIYRTGDKVFYHAVLNVSEDVGTIEKYLQHPPREPEYRQKRSHSDFVTSLSAEGYPIAIELLQKAIRRELKYLAAC